MMQEDLKESSTIQTNVAPIKHSSITNISDDDVPSWSSSEYEQSDDNEEEIVDGEADGRSGKYTVTSDLTDVSDLKTLDSKSNQIDLPIATPKNTERRKPYVEARQLVYYGDLTTSITSPSELESNNDTEDELDEIEDGEDDYEAIESSEDEADSPLKPALVVNEFELNGYDPSTPPTNGSQFICYVQNQRKRTPKIATFSPSNQGDRDPTSSTAEHSTIALFRSEIPSPSGVKSASTVEQFLPTQSWISIITHQFSTLYSKVEYWRELITLHGYHCPLPEDVFLPSCKKKWFLFCFGSKITEQVISYRRQRKSILTCNSTDIVNFFSENLIHDSDESSLVNQAERCLNITREDPLMPKEDTDSSATEQADSDLEDEESAHYNLPYLSILLNMDNALLEDVLQLHIDWIRDFGWFHELQGKWVYALLACIQKPMSCDVMASLRELARICHRIRKKVMESKLDEQSNTVEPSDDEETTIRFKEFMNSLNILICLVGNYFQQYDLADHKLT